MPKSEIVSEQQFLSDPLPLNDVKETKESKEDVLRDFLLYDLPELKV